jgi:hypothetical protein
MAFILLHESSSGKRLVNIDNILEVIDNGGTSCGIYFASGITGWYDESFSDVSHALAEMSLYGPARMTQI